MLKWNEPFAIRRKSRNKVRILFFAICFLAAALLGRTPCAYAALVSDQTNDVTDGTSWGSTGAILSQSFVPSSSNVAAIDLRLRLGGEMTSGNTYTTSIELRDTLLDPATLQQVSTSTPVFGSFDPIYSLDGELVRFSFSPPVIVTPGQTYFIRWIAPNPSILTWMLSIDNPYGNGQSYWGGAGYTDQDVSFITYYEDTYPPPVPTISNITPNYGTITNNLLNFTLYGTGFQSGATVQLTNFVLIDPNLPNPGSIDASGVSIAGTSITGTFDLTKAGIGQYDVVVTNPDGGSAILPKGFTVLDTNPPKTEAIPRGGTFNAPLSVTLQANEPATIRYTTDGNEPNSGSALYTVPIPISSTTTLKFFAVDAALNTEVPKTETYTIDTGFEAIAVLDTPTNELILPVTSTFTFPAGTQAIVVDCQKVNHTLRDLAGNVLPPSDYLKHYVIGPPDTPGSDVKSYSGEVSVTCDLAKLYLPESLLLGNYTLEVNYSHFFQSQPPPPGIQLFQGSISAPSIPVSIAAPITTHFITTEAGAGGSIFLSNSVVSGLVLVKDGSEPTFTITPNPGYHIADVKVDDVSLGALSSYKFPPVVADHTISATFTNVPAGTILVKVVKNTIGMGKRPVVTKSPVVGMAVRAFAKSAGSCAGQYGIISWPHYKNIWNSCPSVAQGVTNSSGEAPLSVPPGTYIVIGRYESNTSDPNDDIYVADNIFNIQANQTRSARLYVFTVANGKHLACKYSEHTGSSLFAIEPEYVEWSGTTELYPFVFDSMGDWNVSVSVAPPEGFVANQTTLSAAVNNDLKSVQFTITDIGSKWISTGVNYEIKHKGKIKKIKSRIGIKLSKILAKKKGMSEYGHVEPKK
jgi:hypothetical protein